jgi:SAM-dependent methyltransferase
MPHGYRDDLAYIHDVGFGHFARSGAPFLLKLLRQNGKPDGLVVDLGCGSGILAKALGDAGYRVLGFDLSPAMIDIAGERAPNADLRVGSFLSAKLPPCVAVTAIGEILNYQFDRRNTERALGQLFRRVHDALDAGGLFIFDVATPGRVVGDGPQKSYRENGDWAVLVEAEEDKTRRRLTRRITSFRRVGELYRRDHEVHRLRLFDPPKLTRQLRAAGFRVRTVSGYGELRFPPGLVGFVARKGTI